ncbi:MAG: membrane-bound lytic murein transglycosylase MltF [Oceanococcus sp.]
MLLFTLQLCVLSTCTLPISKLDQIRATGVLKVATINSPTTFYDSGDGPTGFAYDLALQFAHELGVELDMRITPSAAAALEAVVDQKVHLAAANLTVTDNRSRHILFSPAVRQVTPQLAYRIGSGKPRSLSKLKAPIYIPENSAHEELLTKLAEQHPTLRWETVEDASSEDLLARVGQERMTYTVGDSDLIAMTRRYHHKLGTAMDLGEPSRKAWAFRHHRDSSLFNEATRFLTTMTISGELAILNDRYFGHVDRLDFVSSRSLAQHITNRLPRYRKWFEKAGEQTGIDWRLLAAISYQESHWSAQAKSTTGVRGLMMLTRDTAKYMKVKDRTDPAQSIDGGARYFRFLLDRLPDEIPQPDRVWMALASYNMGYGHLLDVRKLTEKRGGNLNSWIDVRSNLRLLTQDKWHKQTKYGYARGHEAEVYVGNVRTYLDVLNWMTNNEKTRDKSELAKPKVQNKVLQETTSPLDIDLPLL